MKYKEDFGQVHCVGAYFLLLFCAGEG